MLILVLFTLSFPHLFHFHLHLWINIRPPNFARKPIITLWTGDAIIDTLNIAFIIRKVFLFLTHHLINNKLFILIINIISLTALPWLFVRVTFLLFGVFAQF